MPSPLLIRLLGMAAMAVGLWGLLSSPSPWALASAPPTRAARTLPHTDVNPLGAKFFLEREVEGWKQDLTVQMAREAGIGWALLHIPWEDVEPQKGRFTSANRRSTWDKYDRIVSLAEGYGLRLIVRLDRPPAWAHRENDLPSAPPANFEDFGDFVAVVAQRYRGRIQHYQIWNEPNIYPEWGAQAPSPEAYTRLLKIAAQRLRAVDPDALILSAPLAPTLERSGRNLSDLDYLEQLYTAGAKPFFDILMAIGYGFDRPPEEEPDEGALNFRRLELLRAVMVRHGDADKPVWISEFGWNAAPEEFPAEKLTWSRVSEEMQATYTERGLRLAMSWDWLGVVNLWYFRQVGDIPMTDPAYYFRAVDTSFTPRSLYYRLVALGQELRTAGAGRHEETSPAVETLGSWSAWRQAEASGGMALRSAHPGDQLRFRFLGTAVRLGHRIGPGQGRLLVSVDGMAPRQLLKDNQGNAYVDLYSSDVETWRETVLAQGLRWGVHSVEVTVAAEAAAKAPGREVAVDAFFVEAEESQRLFYQSLAALGVGLALLFLSTRRRWLWP